MADTHSMRKLQLIENTRPRRVPRPRATTSSHNNTCGPRRRAPRDHNHRGPCGSRQEYRPGQGRRALAATAAAAAAHTRTARWSLVPWGYKPPSRISAKAQYEDVTWRSSRLPNPPPRALV
eukprot:3469107-Prymnesium_polylepis.1